MVMMESIAATSFFGHRPIYGGISVKDGSCRQKSLNSWCRFSLTDSIRGRIVMSPILHRRKGDRLVRLSVKALAREMTKETHAFREAERAPASWIHQAETSVDQRPPVWAPENRADDPSLQNPLLRLERMGSGWLSAIFELEGVITEDDPDLEIQAWLTLAEEEGRSPPPAFMLRRIEGMKNEQAISEILCWSRNPDELRRMASRKEELHQALEGGVYTLCDGSREFVDNLMHNKIPMALVSTRPRKTLETAIVTAGIQGHFTVTVAAEDVYRGKPDPEMFLYAAQLLKFIPERCIVFGNSNLTVEAARDARMKCVAVASKHPVYELGAADLVVSQLDELSIVDLKKLAVIESDEYGSGEPELEMEMEDEEEYRRPSTSTEVDDTFW